MKNYIGGREGRSSDHRRSEGGGLGEVHLHAEGRGLHHRASSACIDSAIDQIYTTAALIPLLTKAVTAARTAARTARRKERAMARR